MHLALWDTRPVDFLVSGIDGVNGSPWMVDRASPRRCVEALQRGQADVALVPTLVVLSNPDVFDVLPGVALSTWKYPFARLLLREGFQEVNRVGYAPEHMQEALVAQIVLQEHYGQEVTFEPHLEASLDELRTAPGDGVLLVGDDVPFIQSALALDLGQEWFELVAYPMVWGLFAVRKDEGTPAMVQALRDTVKTAEARRQVWLQAHEQPPVLHSFFAEELRLRFDDLATASLTEFRQHLFYYNITEDIPELPMYVVPETARDDDAREPLV